MLKKGLVVGVIFLFMLVSLPFVSGEEIFYPKEEGPYSVLIFGKCTGMGGGFYTVFFHFWPVWLLLYPLDIGWYFDPGSSFFVNGEKQQIVYPADIELRGFKGYGASTLMIVVKYFGFAFLAPLVGFMPTARTRVIGLCTEIAVHDAR